MDETLISNWNERVKPEDHVYHLGDVTMAREGDGSVLASYMSQLKGHKRLILGNHDHYKMGHYLKWFEKVKASNLLEGLLLSHYPVHPESIGRAVGNAHGHIHEKTYPGRYVNVCVEHTRYAPVAIEEVVVLARKAKALAESGVAMID
jgi:calcineurin-like phosphoesterase family protein